MLNAVNTFNNSKSWEAYRDILVDSFGIVFSGDPVERHSHIREHTVRYDQWEPARAPVGTLILVHGGGGNGRILAPCALPALAAGWRVLAPDLPGFGLTLPASGFSWDYAEWPAVVAELANQQEEPVVLMGLSMGGMAAVSAAQASAKVRGVIATTLIDLTEPRTFMRAARWTWLGKLSLLGMRLAPWFFDRLVMPLSLAAPLRAMSSDPDMQAYFIRDPLIGRKWIRARFFRTLHEHRAPSFDIEFPLLLVHPGADSWTPTAMSMAVFEKFTGPKQFRELTNGAHLPIEQPAFDELGGAIRDFLENVVH